MKGVRKTGFARTHRQRRTCGFLADALGQYYVGQLGLFFEMDITSPCN